MTLLALETQQANERVDALWIDWQTRQGWAAPLDGSSLGALHNHHAFVLYEYFPRVSLRVAREVAGASRALGYYALLRESSPHEARGAIEPACEWLLGKAVEHWRAAVGEQALLDHWCAAYDDALHEEQVLLLPGAEPCSAERFAAIAGGKAAPARMTATVLALAAGDRERLPRVLASQAQYYAGLRLAHEVAHWKKTFLAGQRSYTLARLARVARLGHALDPAARAAAVADMGRHFYYSGLAEELLTDASQHFCRAMAAVADLPPNGWGALLAVTFESNERLREDIRRLRAQNLARLGAARSAPAGASPGAGAPERARLDAALEAARCYLAREQDPGGGWCDFMLLAEPSTAWVSGYVGWTLADEPGNVDLARAARWFDAHRSSGGAWGYNSNWPQDADSIAHVLLFLSRRPDVPRSVWAGALEALLAHQNPDGGFATIMDPDAWLRRFRSQTDDLHGWTSSHPCVSAVIALLLARLDDSVPREPAERVRAYLRASQCPDGSWNAYWWQGQFYTTARAIQALGAAGKPADGPVLARAGAWLVAHQRPDGDYAADGTEHGQAFHTALAAQGLAALGAGGDLRAALGRSLRWLLDAQLPDGSWPVVPILRVPHPRRLRPWENDAWRVSILGLDVVVPDWHRVFTTATAIQALQVGLAARAPA